MYVPVKRTRLGFETARDCVRGFLRRGGSVGFRWREGGMGGTCSLLYCVFGGGVEVSVLYCMVNVNVLGGEDVG